MNICLGADSGFLKMNENAYENQINEGCWKTKIHQNENKLSWKCLIQPKLNKLHTIVVIMIQIHISTTKAPNQYGNIFNVHWII